METWERGRATIRGSYALYSFAAAVHAFELLMEQETMMVENNKQTDRHAFVSAGFARSSRLIKRVCPPTASFKPSFLS